MRHSRRFKLIVVVLFVAAMMVAFRYVREQAGPFIGDRLGDGGELISPLARSYGRGVGGEGLPDAENTRVTRIPLDDESENKNSDVKDDPILPADRPDWVAAPDDVSENVHKIVIAGDLENSVEAVREKFDSALLAGVRAYIDRYLAGRSASEAPHPQPLSRKNGRGETESFPIDADWIRKNLAKNAPRYEAVIERPSGTYHQLWTQLSIDSDDRKVMLSWVESSEIRHRVVQVGVGVGVLLLAMSSLHVLLRILSPAETEA